MNSRLDPRLSVDPYISLPIPAKYPTQKHPENHLKMTAESGTVVCAYNVNTQEAGTGGMQGLEKPGLQQHILSEKQIRKQQIPT